MSEHESDWESPDSSSTSSHGTDFQRNNPDGDHAGASLGDPAMQRREELDESAEMEYDPYLSVTDLQEDSDEESEGSSLAGYNHYDGDDDAPDRNLSTREFHPFMRLPIELRREIWDWFCPELGMKGRLLEVALDSRDRHSEGLRKWFARDGRTLETVTRNSRRLLAVHQESRAIALQALPHQFSLDRRTFGDMVIRFNQDVDVVFFALYDRMGFGSDDDDYLDEPDETGHFALPHLAKNVKQVAIDWVIKSSLAHELLSTMPNLEKAFFLTDMIERSSHVDYLKKLSQWWVPDYCHEHHIETFEESPGYGENMMTIYSWPNVDEHKAFYDLQVKRTDVLRKHENHPSRVRRVENDLPCVPYYPMALFELEPHLGLFQAIRKSLAALPPGHQPEPAGSSESESESEEEVDEYESEGIDDDPISEAAESSEDEIIPAPISAGSGSPSDASSSEPANGSPRARFSSPEPDVTPSRPRSLKRRIVSDSDDEEDEDEAEEPRPKRARIGRGAILDSDDFDQDENGGVQGTGTQQRRRQPIMLSDSDDGDEGTGTGVKVSNSKSDSTGSDDDDESRTEDEDEDEDEDDKDEDEEPSTKSISLAERLQAHRRQNPIPESDRDGSSDEEESDGESYDSEEDSDDEGGGLIDRMAAEDHGYDGDGMAGGYWGPESPGDDDDEDDD